MTVSDLFHTPTGTSTAYRPTIVKWPVFQDDLGQLVPERQAIVDLMQQEIMQVAVVQTGILTHAKLQSDHHQWNTNDQFSQAGFPPCHPTNSISALKAEIVSTKTNKTLQILTYFTNMALFKEKILWIPHFSFDYSQTIWNFSPTSLRWKKQYLQQSCWQTVKSQYLCVNTWYIFIIGINSALLQAREINIVAAATTRTKRWHVIVIISATVAWQRNGTSTGTKTGCLARSCDCATQLAVPPGWMLLLRQVYAMINVRLHTHTTHIVLMAIFHVKWG